jgi:AmiR/NasT family two-component response regulator
MSGKDGKDSSINAGPGTELKRVLVAEDEHLIAMSIAEHLTRLGFEVIGPASNGEQAVELARQHKPQLALVDIRMPQMDGLEAAGILFRQMGIPIVVISAFTDEEYLDRGTNVGIFGYLLKPVTADELRVSLEVAWALHGQQQGLSGQVRDLKTALEDRKVIERAKGLVMQRLSLNENEAMRQLQKQARANRQKLPDLARAILAADDMLQGRGQS